MKRYKGFTFDRHKEVGSQLKSIRDQLLYLSVEIANSYGKTKKATGLAEKAYRDLDMLRSAMDSLVCSENKDRDYLEWVRCYYPGRGE